VHKAPGTYCLTLDAAIDASTTAAVATPESVGARLSGVVIQMRDDQGECAENAITVYTNNSNAGIPLGFHVVIP
jgi:hypothetical protein